MAKKTTAPVGENPRRPCPCGSGKRWKACHGAGDDVIVTRPFAGLAAECDLVALRELLPSATAPLPLATPLSVPVTATLRARVFSMAAALKSSFVRTTKWPF